MRRRRLRLTAHSHPSRCGRLCGVCPDDLLNSTRHYFEDSVRRSDLLPGLKAWLQALGPSLRHIFMLAWCAPANMGSTSKIASAPGPKGLAAGFRAFFVSHFHACVVSAGGHGVYFENSPLSAGAGVNPNIVGARAPLPDARHKDGLGETPARAERVLYFHACVVR